MGGAIFKFTGSSGKSAGFARTLNRLCVGPAFLPRSREAQRVSYRIASGLSGGWF
jgi:hypothetical protein